MGSAEDARAYLRQALIDAGVNMAMASEAIGRNHAYIQQYVTKGKPAWLPEGVRLALATAYGIDEERLRPPPVQLREPRPRHVRRNSHDQRQVHSPDAGQFVDDPSQLELIGIWNAIPPDRRQLALAILRNLVDEANTRTG